MAKRQIGTRTKKSRRPDVDGNQIHNRILLALPRGEREIVLSKLELMRLKPLQLLHDVGDHLKSAYFCNSGMISTLSVFPDGKSVEVGLVGTEGFVGLPLLVGFRSSPIRANVQIEGSAFRIGADSLIDCLQRCPTLAMQLQQFSQILGMQVTQIAACNRLHPVEERLARWLLMCADRAGNHRLPLTQELLGQMLGTRRASVTIAAGLLQQAGLIDYTRGDIHILNRGKLEDASCVCYELINEQISRWHSEGQ
jgi:CRP-like cAMP-binding protein